MRSTLRRRTFSRARRLTAIATVVSLITGALALGVAAQMATAAAWAPSVSAENVDPSGAGKDFVLAGENVSFSIDVTNNSGGAQFNLALVASLPANVSYVSGGDLAAPKIYAAGDVLPNRARTAADASCASLGLVNAPGQALLCAVPAGQQIWVWSNVNDLPQGGTVSPTITVAPNDDYPVGAEVGFSIAAYTSNDPTRLPTFDGSPSVSRTTAHTSGAGIATDDVPVKALRIVKDEPSAESELLRGVHTTVTTYTMTVENTTRGATDAVTVTDYLPAGLEYLGLATGNDNSSAAEYAGSPMIDGGTTVGESVDTVQFTASEAAALGLPGAGVYTKIVWTLAPLEAGETRVIEYHAAVPLFANALWAEGSAPDAASGAQAANLDNNTGASTRHGGESTPEAAQAFRNVAVVDGQYQGPVLNDDPALRAAHDEDSEIIEAVDVRVLKRVDKGGLFTTGSVATYSVDLRVSEYVDASDIVLTDVIPNGLCPAFPGSLDGVDLIIGTDKVSQATWNAQAPGDACNYPTTESAAVLSPELHLVSITYTPTDGTFTVVFDVDPMIAGQHFTAQYSVTQRPNYTGAGGGTSSGDSFVNKVSATAKTEPIASIAADPAMRDRVGGARYVFDDSAAVIGSDRTVLDKTVLERGTTPDMEQPEELLKQATKPFSPGDDVWYRLFVDFADGIDSRNPLLTDYLPEGIEVQELRYAYTGIPGSTDVTSPVAYGSPGFPTAYIPNVAPTGASLTWELGARNRTTSGDRFMPEGSTLTVFVRGTVKAQSASQDEVDNPLNQAKYQQVNVDGVLDFQRSDAGIDLDWGSTLTKGIVEVNGRAIAGSFGDRDQSEQVVQGDEVDYRIDVKAPQNSTTDYVVWDVLPAGVKKADVSAPLAELYPAGTRLSSTDAVATMYDAGETLPDGIALTGAFTGRSVIVWKIGASIAGSVAATAATETAPATPESVSGFSLGYTVTVPDGTVDGGGEAAQLTQKYTNTAGIVDYAIENAGGGTTTVVPQRDGGGQQLTTRIPGDGEVPASDIDTVDSAEVYLPDVKIEKKLVSTEVAPVGAPGVTDLGDGTRNPATKIVQGEYATFEYSVTIPARTTIKGAVLSDNGRLALPSNRGSLAYQFLEDDTRYFQDGQALVIGGTAADFRTAGRQGDLRGVLTFPDTYTNSTNTDQVFSARITVWVKDLTSAETLTNTATATFVDPNSTTGSRLTKSATAKVDYIVPAPSLRKTASSAQVGANGTVDFTITASNTSGRPALYDVVVIDCVPQQLRASNAVPSTGQANILDENCSATSAGVITRGSGTGTVIEWKIPMLLGTGTAPTLTYRGTVDEQAGGASQFVNRATLTGHTLPVAVGDDTDTTDRRGTYTANANATVRMPDAGLQKSVSPSSAAVGDVVTYTVTTTLPANTNFYDVVLTDVLPTGVEFVPTGTHTETLQWAGDTRIPIVGAPTLNGRTLSWAISSNDIPAWSDATPRTITVTYQARLMPTVTSGKPVNTASFSWNKINGSNTPSDRVTLNTTAEVTIVDPKVTVAKTVRSAGSAPDAFSNKASGNPDQSFEYRIAVTNTGAVPAYGVVVTDTVPVGISVDTTQEVFAGAVIDDREKLLAGKGGNITWTIPGPLSNVDGSNTHEIAYYGSFAASTGMSKDGVLKNTVAVNEYTSAPNNGWTYVPGDKNRPAGKTPGGVTLTPQAAEADVAPHFPQVELSKSATNDVPAFVGQSFSWTLQATNTGEGAAQTVTLTDTLPENWAYDPTVVPVLTVGGQPPVELDDPALGEDGGRQTISWVLGTDDANPLLPGTIDAATDAQRTLTVTFSSKPELGATTTAGAGLSFAHTNSVSGVATDTTGAESNADGPYVGDPATADAHIARADLKIIKQAIGGDSEGRWTAGESLRDGYTQPQWRLTVTNQGPDAANGPFRIVDEADLPEGVTTGAFTARYFSDADDTEGDPFVVTGTGTSSDPFVVGGATLTLKADGSDRIVLVADVAIDESAVGSASNSASVAGRTFERPEDIAKDNSAEVTVPLASAADLVLTKDVTTTEVTAGRPITWSISVRNDGPSAASTTSVEPERRAAATPITVTDTVPAGIGEVQDPSAGLSEWTVAASDGWPASAGDVITWTYTGSQMPVGAAQQLFLTGTVDASWTDGEIANSAVVDSPVTVDPTPENNEDTATVTPGDQTSLAITKTRVVLDAGEWKDAAPFGGALPEVAAGSTASYRVVVTNNGPADARQVTVTDQAPEMLTFVEVTDELGEWTHIAPEAEAEVEAELVSDDVFALTGTLPAAAGDNTRSFIATYALPVELEPGTEVRNVVVAEAENSTNAPDDLDTTASDRVADLSIVKQAIDGDGAPVADGVVPQVTAGTQTRFLLTVTNNGPSLSSAPIEIVDQLPAGLTYVSSTVDVAGAGSVDAEPTVSEDGRAIAWSVLEEGDVLAPGATIVIEVAAAVAPEVRSQRLVNAADVTGPDDADAGNNHAEAVVDVVTLAELTITKVAADGPWIAGTEVAYTLTVRNEGPSFADALVTDVLPAGLTPVSIEGEGWTCDTAQSCIREAHPLGDSVLTVVARVDANVATGTALTNTATVSWTDSRVTEPHQVSDDAVIDVTTDADLRLIKTAIDADGQQTASAVAGESSRYRIEVSNLGSSDAIGPITVVDQLPAGMRFTGLVGDAATAWSARADDAGPQSVTFTLAPASLGLAAGADAPAIVFDVLVDAAVVDGAVLTNSATVASGTPDANPENDTDTADLTVAREVDLSITKSHVAGAVRIGDELPFAITVRNAGPSEATEVVVTDTVPAGLEVVSAAGSSADGWTIESVAPVDASDAAAGTLVVARYSGVVAPGEATSVLVVDTRVLAGAYPEVVNVADVTAAEITEEHPDRTPEDNRVEDAVTVPPMATLVVEKSAVGAFQVGGSGDFEIMLRNDGPTADPGPIVVTDALPEGLSFVSSPDDAVRVDGQTVTWTLAEGLAVGEQVTLTVRVSVGEAAYPSVTNTVVVASPTEQTNDAELIDDATAPVKPAAPVVISPEDPVVVTPGGPIVVTPGGPVVITPGGAIVITPGGALATTGAELNIWMLAVALLLMLSGGLFVGYHRSREAVAAE